MAATYYDVKSRAAWTTTQPTTVRLGREGGDPKLNTIEGKGRTLGKYLVIELRRALAAGVDEEHVSPPPSAVATRGAADMMLYTTRACGLLTAAGVRSDEPARHLI